MPVSAATDAIERQPVIPDPVLPIVSVSQGRFPHRVVVQSCGQHHRNRRSGAMMQPARIELDLESVSRSPVSGLVTAGIWIRADGQDFPANGWTDSAVVILATLEEGVLRLLRGDSASERVSFMEGPFVVGVDGTRVGPWSMALVQRKRSGDVETSATVEREPFVQSLIHASDRILRICRYREWETVDSIRLANATTALRRFV